MKVRKMYSRIASQIFVWAGEEPLRVTYSGQEFVIPPRNETAKVGRGSIYRNESARDARGELVPGTLVVSDIVQTNNEGNQIRVLKVDEFCDYLTRDRDDLFNRGFNIVSTVQEVAEALEAGIPLYEEAQDRRARDILVAEMDRRKKFEARGEPAPPPEDEHNVIWAIAHLKARESKRQTPKVSMDEIRDALGGTFTPKVEAPKPAVMKVQEIYQEAVELGVSLSKSELAGLLANDADQTEFVLEKIKLKREEAAAAAG